MNQQPKYCFYATLLDSYENYINSSRIYQEYWGFSEEPPFTEEEFQEKQRLSLLDTINRVPFDSADADRGTAFNEIVDCLIENRKSEKMEIYSKQDQGIIIAIYKNQEFYFPISLCTEFRDYFKGASTQIFVDGLLNTRLGLVRLYGYIDELMPISVHDIKMTKRYGVGKFKHHWQHIVYPFCLNQQGNQVQDFEYNVAHINIKKSGFDFTTHTEHYAYNPERDVPKLIGHTEGLIEFIERHMDWITDKKIFNAL